MKIIFTLITALVFSFPSLAQLPADSLALWLRSDAGVVTSGLNVTQWTDQSGKGRNAVPTLSTFPQLITNQLCGKPVVRFNSNTGLATPAFQTFPNKRGTMFVVTKCTGGTGGFGFGTIVSTYVGTGVQWQTGVYASTASYAWYDGTGSSNINITSSPINQWGIVTYDRRQNDTLRLYKSGALAGKLPIANNQPSTNVFLIGYNSFSEFLNGDIAEIIVYTRALADSEIYQVNTYLANKYCFNSTIAAPTAPDQHRCGAGTVALTASGGVHYRWYDSLTSSTILDTNASFTTPPLNATDTFYVASYNDTLEGPRTRVIAFVHPLPTVSFIIPPSQDTVCLSDPGFTLTGQSPVGGSFSGPGVTGNTFNPLVAGLGTKAIIYSYTDGNTCTNTAAQNIQVIVCVPLSVKIDAISARNIEGTIRVAWHTASEEGNDNSFEIERSGNGRDFTSISRQKAKGVPSSYSYLDESPVDMLNYYRLKMITDNNKFEYSAVITATNNNTPGFSMSAWPNPAFDKLTLKLVGVTGTDAHIYLTSVTGKLIEVQQSAGAETVINVSNLSSGTYLLKYIDSHQAATIRISIN